MGTDNAWAVCTWYVWGLETNWLEASRGHCLGIWSRIQRNRHRNHKSESADTISRWILCTRNRITFSKLYLIQQALSDSTSFCMFLQVCYMFFPVSFFLLRLGKLPFDATFSNRNETFASHLAMQHMLEILVEVGSRYLSRSCFHWSARRWLCLVVWRFVARPTIFVEVCWSWIELYCIIYVEHCWTNF